MTKQDKRFLEINQGENWINIEHKTLIFECRFDLGWSVSAATEIKRKLYVTKQVHQNTLFYNKEDRQKGLDKINMCSFVVPSTPEYLHSLQSSYLLYTYSHCFSHAVIGWLCPMPACYWSNNVLVISFSKYENNRETKAQHRHHSIYWFLIWKLVGEMVWECEWGKFISDRAWTCGAGRTRADLVNNSSVWSAGSSDGPVQAAGSGSAPPGCGYWRSSALYSAACPASVTATAQSHYTAMQDLHSSCIMKEEKNI